MKKNTLAHKIKRLLRGSPTDWHNLPPRTIIPNHPDPQFPNNKIVTSKYTIYTFLPLNLYEQFTKIANIYFLVVGILQMIPAISVSDGLPTEYTPLVVIVILTAIKDIIEDLQRHKADWKENHQIFENGYETPIRAQDIRVGDIIRVNQDQTAPADLLLIHSDCLIETSQLDGESNIKPKVHVKCQQINTIKAEGPNPYLYKFAATINDSIPCNENNLVLRGCTIKSQGYAEGIVIYTGCESKIMLNQHKPRGKATQMQKLMGYLILYLWLVQWILCAFCATYNTITISIDHNQVPYLYLDQPVFNSEFYFTNFWVRLGNWFILFVNFVPISLMLTLEMIRLLQGYIITSDIPNSTVQSSNLNDDLGQIKHIFTDKTGTLTCNKMILKSLYMNTYIEEGDQLPENKDTRMTMLNMALCNDVHILGGQYMSQSPDELALLNYAKSVGYDLIDKQAQICTVMTQSGRLQAQLLNTIEFTSDRKRMSVIIELDEQIYLLMKGADVVMFPKINNLPKQYIEAMETYCTKGLRGLVLAYTQIDKQSYTNWSNKYQQAKSEFNLQQCSELIDQIENGLTILAVTGVEDKLQDQVPQTIKQLQFANIALWILTGDQIGTAISVARTSNLISTRDKVIVMNENIVDVEQQLIDLEEQRYVAYNNKIEACLIMPGHTLHSLSLEQKLDFIKLGNKCKGVVLCRVSPKQKREIVELYQQCYPNNRTLAIGDGANDVNMITEANVGIGIKGIEGMQAARCSDYAIPEFKCLQRLLLYHGRECYRRNSQVVLYNFYKNVLYLMCQFWFGFWSDFSGQSIYDFFVFQCFNFMFTSLPIIVYGVMDIQHDDMDPQLYSVGQSNGHLNILIFWINILDACYQSALLFYLIFLTFNATAINGNEYGLIVQGQIVFLACVIVANVKILLMCHQIQLCQVITQSLSYISYIFTIIVANFIVTYMLYMTYTEMLSSVIFYFIIVLACWMSICIQIATVRLLPQKYNICEGFRQMLANQKRNSIAMQNNVQHLAIL